MKHSPKFAISILALAVSTSAAYGQGFTLHDPASQDRSQQGAISTDQPMPNTAGAMSLSQLAMMQPDKLEGVRVVDNAGEEIGEIDQIARSNSESALYAVVDRGWTRQSAVELSELSVNALAYAESADVMDDYDSAGYERLTLTQHGTNISSDQSGATDQGQAGVNQSPEAGRTVAPTQANTAGQNGQIDRSSQSSLDDSTDQSVVEQLVMDQPDQLEGKKLVSEDGDELGQIDHFARSLTGDQIVAVIDRNEGSGQAVVELQNLEIAEMQFEGDEEQLEERSFDESEYQILSSAF